jgi:hypothetical protein
VLSIENCIAARQKIAAEESRRISSNDSTPIIDDFSA